MRRPLFHSNPGRTLRIGRFEFFDGQETTPERNVDLHYLAFTKYAAKDRFFVRVFALDYHDGRAGLTRTDNRALAVRAADHCNIRLGTYGTNALTTIPAPPSPSSMPTPAAKASSLPSTPPATPRSTVSSKSPTAGVFPRNP